MVHFDHTAFKAWVEAADRHPAIRMAAQRCPPAAIYGHKDWGVVLVVGYGPRGDVLVNDLAGRTWAVDASSLRDLTAQVRTALGA